jgi:isocitrate dehydrogenase
MLNKRLKIMIDLDGDNIGAQFEEAVRKGYVGKKDLMLIVSVEALEMTAHNIPRDIIPAINEASIVINDAMETFKASSGIPKEYFHPVDDTTKK